KGATWNGFLYNADPGSDLTWLYRVLGVAAGLLVLGGAIHFSLLTRERTRAEETIRKGEQRFRTMFEAAPMGIALIDSGDGQFRDVHPRFAESAGRSSQDNSHC